MQGGPPTPKKKEKKSVLHGGPGPSKENLLALPLAGARDWRSFFLILHGSPSKENFLALPVASAKDLEVHGWLAGITVSVGG